MARYIALTFEALLAIFFIKLNFVFLILKTVISCVAAAAVFVSVFIVVVTVTTASTEKNP